MNQKALKMIDNGEIRCISCGRLLLKGKIVFGSELILRCRNSKCEFKHKDMKITILVK